MSARDLRQPGMGSVLSVAVRDLRVTESRQRWSGAMSEVAEDIDTASYTPIQDPADPGYPEDDMTLAATLTLDPGRWVVVGSAVQSIDAGAAIEPDPLEVGIVIVSDDGTTTSSVTATAGGAFGPNFPVYENVAAALRFVAVAQVTVDLYVFVGAGAGLSSITQHTYGARILAFPA